MARPQVEDGHIDIANELGEALCRVNLSAYESRILWAIFRKTYGWHKKSDRISYGQFEEITGIKHRHIGRTLHCLTAKNLINISGEGYALEYSIQKDYEQWKFSTRLGTNSVPKEVPKDDDKSVPIQGESVPIQGESVPKEVPNSVPKEVHTKEKKETIQKKLYKRKSTRARGEFSNVHITDEDYDKLAVRFGAQGAADWIEELSLAKASKGYKTKSDYATILAWERRRQKMGNSYTQQKAGGGNGRSEKYRGLPGNRPSGAFADIKDDGS